MVGIGELGLAHRAALHKDESADLIFGDQVLNILDVRSVFIGVRRHHEQLSDLLVEGHHLHEGVYPGVVLIEEGHGLLFRFHGYDRLLGSGGQAEGQEEYDE